MNIFQAAILGIVQGLTEFLPVSSSAHLSIFGKLFGFEVSGEGGLGFEAFSAVIQVGTELAVILYFIKDIARILKAWFVTFGTAIKGGPNKKTVQKIGQDARMGWLIILCTIPIVVGGIFASALGIDTAVRSLWITAAALILVGVIMAFVDTLAPQRFALEDIGTKRGLVYGFAQICALIPGVSRSGATMTAGRALGFSRESAAKFSFYLAIPSVFGAGLFQLKNAVSNFDNPSFPGVGATITATIVSFVVGYFVIAAFMRVISKISLKGFALYRVIIGIALVLMLGTGIITA